MRIASSRILIALAVGLTLSACNNDKGDTTVTDDSGTNPTGDCDTDQDGDGICADEDCDDLDAQVYPGATEECDGIDNDCDDEIDEGVQGTYYYDGDGDGFGDDATATEACEALTDYSPVGGDCQDDDETVYPGAEELCDGVDNDCDDIVDNGLDSGTWYADSDGDGFGDPDSSVSGCEQPPGSVDNDYDCNDSAPEEPVLVGGDGTFDWGTMSTTADETTVQDGIDAAEECVLVDADTYNEDITFNGKDIRVTGVDGASATTIQGTGDGSVVTFNDGESSSAILEGFTVTGGTGMMDDSGSTTEPCGSGDTCIINVYAYYGGGIYIDGASPSLYDLVVTDNVLPPYSYTEVSSTEWTYVYSYGGGIYAQDSKSMLDGVWAIDNYADMGGGLYAGSSSSLSLTANGFDGNGASAGGGVATAGTVTATNAIFVNNGSEETDVSYGGAGVDVSGIAYLTNVAAAGNDGMASVYTGAAGSTTVMNSILVENEDGAIFDGEAGSALGVTFSDAYNTTGSTYSSIYTDPTGSDGNISSDPMFVAWSDDDNYGNDDLNLAAGSPGIDAGSPVAIYNDTDGSTNDMGAYGGPGGGW